jgi:hypothetical protein
VQIAHAAQLLIGKEIIDRQLSRISWKLRTELFSRRAGYPPRAQLNYQIGSISNQIGTHLDYLGLWDTKS